jgi:hypothetical protein
MKRKFERLDGENTANSYAGEEIALLFSERLSKTNALEFISIDLRMKLIRQLSKNTVDAS